MSAKDKELSKSKIKSFFNKAKISSGITRERSLRPEIESELKPELPAAQRCKTLKDLGNLQLQNLNLEEASISKLWDLTKDLIVPNKPAEYRQTTLSFYKKLILTQYKNLNIMREHFFLVIQNHDVPEDLRHRLELLDTLTENGKDINNFEEKIGKFMLYWIPAIREANLLRPYLEILVNLIKFNAAHLDNDIIVGIVHNACNLSCTVEDDEIGLQCLTILEMVMGYTIFPSYPLPQCVFTMCRTVNHKPYCSASWKIMKNLLGTQLGYDSMKIMCSMLNDRSLYGDQQLLRGAVFHLYANIFGSNVIFQVSSMFYASTVLTSFLHALDSRQDTVTFEVTLSTRNVITKYKAELPEIIWDRICDILDAVVDNIEYYESINVNAGRIQHLQISFHDVINCIEKLLHEDKAHLLADCDRIYRLIERVAEQRPEASLINLVEFRATQVTATRPEWLSLLNEFVRLFYNMSNVNIRIKTIQSLVRIMDINRVSYEEEIIERVVLPHFSQITYEPDVQIRTAVAKALIEFSRHCDTKRCGELLDILANIINRPFEYAESEQVVKSETDILDVLVAIDGLIDVFVIKLYRTPACHAIKIFNILIAHLELQYDRPRVFEHSSKVRYKILCWFLRTRANSTYHIGYPDPVNSETVKFSPFLGIDSIITYQYQQRQLNTSHELPTAAVPASASTNISIRRAFKILIKSLECERDFQVFQLVIKELPKMLHNKALIQGNEIETLTSALFKVFSETNKSTLLSYKPTTDELHALTLPAIAALVIYHQSIHPTHQINIITALSKGIFSNIATVCINTMTTMILEMPEALMRRLPDILLQMSKMTDTTVVAIPVLEFLSILSRLSNHLFTNFIPRQYMYVFAISLPYTKPHRYDHYTVSLAHHVIAGWFLKCKVDMRKNFVNYIISSIQSHASMLYEDINMLTRNNFNSLNEDSSNRKRSTSLTERGTRNTQTNNARNDSEMRPSMNDSLKSFHAELAETCIDFLARHTFSPCSALPKRLPVVDYLLKDGLTQTWLVGHNLVTITTSGCPSGPNRNGLCDRCGQLGKAPSLSATNKSDSGSGTAPLSPEINVQQSQSSASVQSTTASVNERRYTKVSLQHSSGNDSAGSTDLTSSSSSTSAIASSNTNTNTTQRQTSNSSTASLETLSRRGSNPEPSDGVAAVATSGSSASLLGNPFNMPSASASPTHLQPVQQQTCIRACTGWAEVYIRRPTGNISWVMRLQNPIANDCFGQDMPFSNMVSLFLPTEHGGVFGPDFVQSALNDEELPANNNLVVTSTVTTTAAATAATAAGESTETLLHDHIIAKLGTDMQRKMTSNKVRALQRQEEISSASTAAIDIPRTASKRVKDALSGSVSDGEADEESAGFTRSHKRKPVRRVNSSPEMRESWREHFLAGKPEPLSKEVTKLNVLSADDAGSVISGACTDAQKQHKKKSVQYTKDMRCSCEAIPEEIAGSTPPTTAAAASIVTDTKLMDAIKLLDTNSLPPKQRSADDVSSVNLLTVQQSGSASSLKSQANENNVAKPPVSPAPPLSPKSEMKHNNATQKMTTFSQPTLHGLAKSSSSGSSSAAIIGTATSGLGSNGTSLSAALEDYNNSDMMRGRSKTISVVREVNNGKTRQTTTTFRSFTAGAQKPPLNAKLCINPSFVFMQLYHTGQLQVTDVPLKVPPEHSNVLTLLDLAPPFETHNIGVLYVSSGQCHDVVEILRNSHGSVRYVEFLRNIGTLVSLKEAEQNNLHVSLDKGGADGKFTYIWKDDIVMVTFHVATLMPTNLKTDPKCNEKKKHIGNDYVKIIYNESGEEYNMSTISGQFNYACVIVEPLEMNTNRVYVKARPEISKFVCHPEPKIVSDRNAPILARQLALHANLASNVFQSLQKKNPYPYASNWLERLRIIKRLRRKLIDNQNSQHQSGTGSTEMDTQNNADSIKKQTTNRDFTKYT